MTGKEALYIILAYFALLIGISYLTSLNSTKKSFFTGDRKSPWFLVAFGMIGATLSGITFISIPGSVYEKGMLYMPMTFGFFFGYLAVAFILVPLYYRLNLTSIYTYLRDRFGTYSFKTGAVSFLVSRIVGASLRLYLVAQVLDIFLFEPTGIPYWLGVLATIGLIWVYTFKSGIKTIVWTDTLQTAAILFAAGATIYFLSTLNSDGFGGLFDTLEKSEMLSFKGGVLKSENPWLGIFNGAIFAIVMSGLDQDIMQKNLTCKNSKEASKNIFWFSVVLVPINFVFLALGVLLFETFMDNGDLTFQMVEKVNELGEVIKEPLYQLRDGSKMVEVAKDQIYPSLAKFGYFPKWLSVIFLIGLIAAAYSSADSALTSLTTSMCIDIFEKEDEKTRIFVHVLMSFILFGVIMIFKFINEDGIIWALFKWTGFTYGPLLGLYSVGILTKLKVNDFVVPFIAVFSAISSFLLAHFFGLGFEILAINGLITAVGLLIFQRKETDSKPQIVDENA